MRTYTLLLSIVCHLVAVCAIVVATVTAADEFPVVRRAIDFVEVVPPPPPPAPPRVREQVRPQVADGAPVEAPAGVAPEPPAVDSMPADTHVDSIVVSDLTGIPPIVGNEPPPPEPPREPIHVGGQIQPPRKVVNVAPVYPPIARAAGVQGVVILEAVIGEDGSVTDVRVLRSIQLLDSAAIEAVRQWRFTPTLLNGTPVPVVMTVTVAFNLRP